ncbi:hypothetical protein GNF45_14710 [Clostridium perfringens]|uniref:hypothetical protein n=1 Tax=Clostridium perfringens TaxID=1502 RepID=UPI002AC6A483|nr:hypothetical protein [Clostridium perfringens]MDZ5044083.1 hypothetical protein [Clostridium perfringens]
MNFDFLDDQHMRMKKIGAYSILFRNSIAKGTWKKYGFSEWYEQDNLIFTVLLYIMEESLKNDMCTIDNIGYFIDEINSIHFKKELSYEECKELDEFIVNTILCNEGKVMYFKAYNFKKAQYEDININFVKNRMQYVDDVRRVVYSITDDGYSFILSTLEVEENLKITIHEILFKMHLEKASYDKAVDDIKNIFNRYRIRVKSIEDAIRKIKENPLSYTTEDYENMMEGNLNLLNKIKEKLIIHREMVELRINEFLENDININKLNKKEEENLNNLKIIKNYLGRTIDEDQKLLKKHFDLKDVYGMELETISKMALIERFNFRNEVYEKILDDPNMLENIDIFLRPLLKRELPKKYNINKSLEYQKNINKDYSEEDEELSFEESDFIDEINKKKIEKLKKYNDVITLILELSMKQGGISLREIQELIKESNELMEKLIPTVEIFREVIIEMLKNRNINVNEIREERKNAIENGEIEFQLNKSILEVLDNNSELNIIKEININKLIDKDDIKLEGVKTEDGEFKNFICSDILFESIRGDKNGLFYGRSKDQ